MRTHTIALVVSDEPENGALLEILCDLEEIQWMEGALMSGRHDPLKEIYHQRGLQEQKEVEFEDYVEALLSQPFLDLEVQEQGVQWFKSRIKIEQYRKSEQEAARIIAEYAYKIFQTDSTKTDFFLESTHSRVRIRIFTLALSKAS